MRKLIYYVAVAFISLSFCYSDGFAQGASKKEFNVQNAGKTYQLQKDSLVVVINNINEYDVVAIEPAFFNSSKTKQPITVKAWEISYSQDNASNSAMKLSKLENITPLESNMNFDRGVLMVNGLGDINKRSVIHLALPTGVNTKVYINGNVVFNGSLSGDGLMIQNATNISSKGYSAEAALMQAVIPKTNKPTPTSYKRIDWQTLSTMAVKTISTPVAFSDGKENWAMVQVDVSETGKVKAVLYAGGNESLANISKQYLSQYEFKPFVVNDKAIKVKALVPITVVDGQIKLFSQFSQGGN